MKKLAGIWAVLLLTAIMISGCGNAADEKDSNAKQKTAASEAFPVTIDDASNQDVTIKKEPKKLFR